MRISAILSQTNNTDTTEKLRIKDEKNEIPKVIFPRNDISDKFWLSVKPFCENVSKDDVNFLNSLIRECSQDTSVEIPHVGEHYTMDWSSDVLRYECDLNSQKQGSTKTVSVKKELKKSGLNAMVDTCSGPFSQRLIAALIEEKESAKANDELECNKLRKLKSIVDKDVRRQSVENSLQAVDEQVIKTYNRVQDAKQAQSSPSDDTLCDSISLQDEDSDTVEDEEINKLIQKQGSLHKELTDLSNATFFLN
ncbi:hypothetical protein FQR65_LT18643 [Abscondita terminalis]|nr:hypothetical protein FQR65_LT18643 [Abscondita terminalis]